MTSLLGIMISAVISAYSASFSALPAPASAPEANTGDVVITEKAVKTASAKTRKVMVMTVTAYSSSVDETDDTPNVTASNTRTRDGIVATNALPFGTKVRIPDYFGDKEFVVEDRMHRRHADRVDVWFPSKGEAMQFGIVRNAEIHVLADLVDR